MITHKTVKYVVYVTMMAMARKLMIQEQVIAQTAAQMKVIGAQGEAEALKISRKKMTRFEQPVSFEKIEMEVMTLDKARANMAEYLRKMHNNTK